MRFVGMMCELQDGRCINMHRLSTVAATTINAFQPHSQYRPMQNQVVGLCLIGGSQANVQLAVVSLTITL